ncbi:MAG: hypothetical protein BHK79_07110 [Halanaerobium sp. MDAL1]|nr:MAG: hypothetical protein BHK79_07110 [Halanaerobium sp. MDAL1]
MVLYKYGRGNFLEMSRYEKLYEKFNRTPTPTGLRFADAKNLLFAYGFDMRQPSGGSSHYIFFHPRIDNYHITIAKDGNKIKPHYVRETVKAVDRVKEELIGGE